MRFAAVSVAACTAAALTLSACGGTGSSSAGRSETALQGALGQVADTSATRADLLFSQPDALLVAGKGSLVNAYKTGLSLGLGSLGLVFTLADKYLGFDPADASIAVTAGDLPNSSELLTGLSTRGIPPKLKALGARNTGPFYRVLPDRSFGHPRAAVRPPFGSPGLLGLDVIQFDSSTVRYSTSAAGLHTVDPTGPTLADNPSFRAASSCLGDPLAAQISDHVPTLRGSRVPASEIPPATTGVRVAAVGLSGRRGTDPRETMCIVASSTGTATRIEQSVRTAIRSGHSLVDEEAWSDLLPGATVVRSGTTIRLTARLTGRTLTLFEAFEQGDPPGVTG